MNKKIVTVALTLALLISTASATALESVQYDTDTITYTIVDPRASDQIRQYTTGLSVNASGQLVVSYTIFGMQNPMTEIGAYSIKIQRKVSASSWQTIETIDGTSSTSAWYHSQEEIVTASVGVYRAEIELFATNSKGSDTRTAYTVEKTIM